MSHFKLISLLTEECNRLCGPCSSNSGPGKGNHIETQTVLDILKAFSDPFAYEGKVQSTHIVAGGEPTLHPRLAEILECSMNEWYITIVESNGSWINLESPEKTRKFLRETFPRGIVIRTSYNTPLLEQDPQMLRRILQLHDIAGDDWKLQVNITYNGPEEKAHLYHAIESQGINDIVDCPFQSMGRGRTIKNLNEPEQSTCEKGLSEGFVLTPQGTYFCLRAACNDIEHLRLTEGYDVDEIRTALRQFKGAVHKIDRVIGSYNFIKKNHHFCDNCEAGISNVQLL